LPEFGQGLARKISSIVVVDGKARRARRCCCYQHPGALLLLATPTTMVVQGSSLALLQMQPVRAAPRMVVGEDNLGRYCWVQRQLWLPLKSPLAVRARYPTGLHIIEEGEKEMDLGFQGILPLYLSPLML